VVGRTGENFGVEKRWKKKKSGQGGWDFRSSGKRPQRAHPQLVHWWVLIHSSRTNQPHVSIYLVVPSKCFKAMPHLVIGHFFFLYL
jgi:hypothetical protein